MKRRKRIAYRLSRVCAVSLVAVGAFGGAFPQPLGRAFGLDANDENTVAFVRATAVRDVALGSLMLVACDARDRRLLATAAACGSCISLIDALNVFIAGDGRVPPTSCAAHLGGAALFAATFMLLR